MPDEEFDFEHIVVCDTCAHPRGTHSGGNRADVPTPCLEPGCTCTAFVPVP